MRSPKEHPAPGDELTHRGYRYRVVSANGQTVTYDIYRGDAKLTQQPASTSLHGWREISAAWRVIKRSEQEKLCEGKQ